MFTGIINHLGIFIKQTENGFKFRLPKDLSKQVTEGSSISIDGVCFTVTKKEINNIFVDVMEETIKKTTLGRLKPNNLVNLELPVTSQTLFSGHIVQGHIDGIATIGDITKVGDSHILRFSVPSSLSKYIVSKGSIALSGIALTVIEAGKDYFTVGIIPFTWHNTRLHTLKIGDFVNIEVDILGKYLEKLMKI